MLDTPTNFANSSGISYSNSTHGYKSNKLSHITYAVDLVFKNETVNRIKEVISSIYIQSPLTKANLPEKLGVFWRTQDFCKGKFIFGNLSKKNLVQFFSIKWYKSTRNVQKIKFLKSSRKVNFSEKLP